MISADRKRIKRADRNAKKLKSMFQKVSLVAKVYLDNLSILSNLLFSDKKSFIYN